ncbi:hypothetical protein GDO81_017917, partial [Engystomops pustulosus]
HVRSAVLRDAQSQSPLDPGLFLNAGMPERFHMNKISGKCSPALEVQCLTEYLSPSILPARQLFYQLTDYSSSCNYLGQLQDIN